MNWKKYQPMLIPGIIIFLAGFSLIIILPQQIRALVRERYQLKRTQKEIEELKTKYLLVSSLDQETLADQARLALAAVPKEKNVPLVLQAVRTSLGRAGFLIKTLRFAPGEISKQEETEKSKKTKGSKKRIEELPLDLEIVGPLDQLEDLFSSIEESLPLFQINSVEITSSRKTANRALIKLRLITFYSPSLAGQQPEKIALKDLVLDEKEIKLLEKLDQFNLTELGSKKVVVKPEPEASSGRENPFTFP